MDSNSLDFLLRGGHINMPDRIDLGIWPHPPIKISEIINHIKLRLQKEGCFPRPWNNRNKGEVIDDACVIVRVSENMYVFRSRSAHPVDLLKIINEQKIPFSNAEEAIRSYLKHELNLPGDLDGWKVVE